MKYIRCPECHHFYIVDDDEVNSTGWYAGVLVCAVCDAIDWAVVMPLPLGEARPVRGEGRFDSARWLDRCVAICASTDHISVVPLQRTGTVRCGGVRALIRLWLEVMRGAIGTPPHRAPESGGHDATIIVD
jgi:hypothetical protein